MEAGSKRPLTIRIVLSGLIVLALWEGGKVFALSMQIRLLLELAIQPDPRWRLALAAGWLILLLGTAVALWRKKTFARWLVPGVLLLYIAYQFALTVLFVRAPGDSARWLAEILLATAVVLFSIWALNRKTATSYFVEEGQQAASAG